MAYTAEGQRLRNNLFNFKINLDALRAIIDKVPAMVVGRVQAEGRGGGSEKRAFSPYNPRYAKQKGKTGHKDFTDTGKMWASYKVVDEKVGDNSITYTLTTTDGRGSNGEYLTDIHSQTRTAHPRGGTQGESQNILDIDDGAVSDVRLRGNQTTDARLGAYNFYNTAASDTVAAISADRDGADDAGALAFDTQVAGGGMTERERIISVLKRQKPDRVPWATRLDIWFGSHTQTGDLPVKYHNTDVMAVHDDVGVGRQSYVRIAKMKLHQVEMVTILDDIFNSDHRVLDKDREVLSDTQEKIRFL